MASPAGATAPHSAPGASSSPSTTTPNSPAGHPGARRRALDAEPDLAAIACRILVHATGADDLSSWGYPPSLLPRAAESFDATTFVGAGHALRRADFEAAGGYDDALFFCWEEYDWRLRAINMGRRIRYRGDIAVRHKVSREHRFTWSGTRWFHFVATASTSR